MERDYQADLAIFEPGRAISDMQFYCFAREALPYYIKRCMELEEQVGQMRELLEEACRKCQDCIGICDKEKICWIKDALQTPAPARWEKMQLLERQLEIASKEITDANSSIGDYGDLCPAEYDNSIKCSCSGTISDVWECWRKRWRDKALADLEGGGSSETQANN